jgi:hypothetical protein
MTYSILRSPGSTLKYSTMSTFSYYLYVYHISMIYLSHLFYYLCHCSSLSWLQSVSSYVKGCVGVYTILGVYELCPGRTNLSVDP